MKRYFDRNDKVLNVGDVIRFTQYGEEVIGKITKLKKRSSPYQNFDIAYITSIRDYRFGTWEATCTLSKVPDEELMLMMLENG